MNVCYIVHRLYVCPPIQEEGDGGIITISSSLMEGGISILNQGHTDRQTDTDQQDAFMYNIYKMR